MRTAPVKVNLTQSLERLSVFIDKYNEPFDPATELAKRIRGNTLAVAERLLKVLSFVSKKGQNEGTRFRTNTAALAKLTKFSPRTIQRHLNRLEEACVITDRRPRTAPTTESRYWFNYYLEINPEIVQFHESQAVKPVDNQANNVDNSVNNHTDCPFLDHLEPEAANRLKTVIDSDLQAKAAPAPPLQKTNLSHIGSREPLEHLEPTRTLSGIFNEKFPGNVIFLKKPIREIFQGREPFLNLTGTDFPVRLAAKVRPKMQVVRQVLEQFFRAGGGQKKSLRSKRKDQLTCHKSKISAWTSSIVAPLQSYLQGLRYGISVIHQRFLTKPLTCEQS